MAKKKKKKGGRRRSYKKKTRRSKPKATPLGSTLGLAYGGYNGIFVPAAGTTGSLWDAAAAMNPTLLATRLPIVVKDEKVWKPVLMGFLVSAAPSLPIVKLGAKPVDRVMKRLTKGKVGL